MAKKKKRTVKHSIRFFFAFVLFGVITALLGYNLFNNVMAISKMKMEKKELNEKLAQLETEKKILQGDVQKLEDPDYIAKYVREKYFYSKDGEVILRID